MAKKAKAAKGNGSLKQAKLPAGFTAIAAGGDFGEWHDWRKSPILTGKVVETGKIDGEYGAQRTMTVQNGKVLSTFSESKALQGLFDYKGIKGKSVWIKFLGAVEFGKPNRKGERRTIKQFQVAVK